MLQVFEEVDYFDMFKHVFASRDDLLKWTRNIAYDFGFVIVILRSKITNGQQGRKTYVLLRCERKSKYRRYKGLRCYRKWKQKM